jgi:hypothetical protein
MKATPRWQSVKSGGGSRPGAMIECPQCGYASWKGAACAFCGTDLQAPGTGVMQGTIPRMAYSSIFLIWFSGGLIAGLLCLSPFTLAPGSPLRARLEHYLALLQPARNP